MSAGGKCLHDTCDHVRLFFVELCFQTHFLLGCLHRQVVDFVDTMEDSSILHLMVYKT